MATEVETENSLGYTPTWVVAGVCFVIVLISLIVERGLHRLGKLLKHKKQDALFEALQKLKEELMLLGFISLLLTVSQSAISHICIPKRLSTGMLPCKEASGSSESHGALLHDVTSHWRRLLSEEASGVSCKKGEVPLLSLEALHQLHIFIFVLAVVHAIFCATTMVLGGAKIRQWKHWEELLWHEPEGSKANEKIHASHHAFFKHRAEGYWRKAAVISWTMSFFRQFYHSVKKADYLALRLGFIKTHCPSNHKFNFHKYMMRTLEVDFKKIVGISWYLWLFVVVFLLLNVAGWHTYFWLAFLPLILLLLVGAKLEHIIARLALETSEHQNQLEPVRPSDDHFWFHQPAIILRLIHFILFQNSFEIAFFFWIWSTYGFHSCIMEKLGYIITRLIIGVIVQVLCSYSTLPLYALVTQMGSKFKRGMFDEHVQSTLDLWVGSSTKRMVQEPSQIPHSAEQQMVAIQETTESITEISSQP
ncbi:hypothetical protein ACFE04_001759 [Oxalis oulophora]